MAELTAHADGQTDSAKIVVEGPPAALPATSAQTLALAVHELSTNAAKYGALAQAGGKLTVRWKLDPDGSESRVLLEWRESGVVMPEADAPRRKGYGTELIQRALPYQLRTKTELQFGPDGVHCTITLPVRVGGGKNS